MSTNYLEDLPPGRDVPNIINAVIEIPKGSSNKYEYDKQYNIFRLDRTLYSPVHYPGAYGFVPQTHAEDGDPLDVVVIVESPTFVGCLIEVRPIGVLIMRDDAGLDHKILAVPVRDPRTRDITRLQHLPSHYLAEVDYFFNIYKDLEGKKSDTYGWEDRLVAQDVIKNCAQRYKDLKAGLVDREGKPVPGKRRAKSVSGAPDLAIGSPSEGWENTTVVRRAKSGADAATQGALVANHEGKAGAKRGKAAAKGGKKGQKG